MADWNKYVLNRLFLAIPELQIDELLLNQLRNEGLVDDEDLRIAQTVRSKGKKYANLAGSMRDKSLVERLLLVAPEILSSATIDILRRWGLISPTLGNTLRIGLRAGKAAVPGTVSEKTILERFAAAGKSVLSFETINLLRDLDNERLKGLKEGLGFGKEDKDRRAAINELLRQSVLRGNILRSVLSTGRLSAETIAAAKNANTVWGALTVIFDGVFSDRLLKDAIRVGAISQERYELISALSKLGLNIWKKGVKAITQDSLEARMLLMSEGILSPEMITALRQMGIISDDLAKLLYPAAKGIRTVTRGRLSNHMKGIRVRVSPTESPIKSYARVTGATERQILKLLAEAAADSRKEALRLMKQPGFAKLTRAAQQRLVENALHLQMRSVWEGVGHLTIFGEKEAARAALASSDFLQNRLWKDTGKLGADYRRTIQREANAGIDAFISRSENIHPFSRRVYKNNALARDLVSRRVNIALLRGLSAEEFAREVAGLIRPGTAVNYNAMRLARTEINNAFHFTQIRYTREMPWVDGYVWNLSGSHPTIDICNTMAQQNHDGIGRGTYKKGNVPGKPHPHCFCYLTTVVADTKKFERQLLNGSYDPYLKNQDRMGESSGYHADYAAQAREVAKQGSTALGIKAIRTIGSSLLL